MQGEHTCTQSFSNQKSNKNWAQMMLKLEFRITYLGNSHSLVIRMNNLLQVDHMLMKCSESKNTDKKLRKEMSGMNQITQKFWIFFQQKSKSLTFCTLFE